MMKACLKRNVPSAKNLSLSRVGKKGNALVYIEHYDAVLIYELAMEIRSPVVGVALIITWTLVLPTFLKQFLILLVVQFCFFQGLILASFVVDK